MRVDDLVEMSRKMKHRLDGLRQSQDETVERLARGVEGLKGVIDAASEAVKV